MQQHGAFAGTLSVVENAVLGVEPRAGRCWTSARPRRRSRGSARSSGLPVDPWARVDRLSLGAAQRAEIVAALQRGAKLLLLDEPTAVLAPVEVDGLLATLRALAEAGTTIVIVTHKLDEVRAVADAVTVLRAGKTVRRVRERGARRRRSRARWSETRDGDGDDSDHVAVAGAVAVHDHGRPRRRGRRCAGVAATRRVAGSEVSLTVRAGEIVGVAGVDGNGQRELALAIAGLVPSRGRVKLGGRDVSRRDRRAQRLARGLAHVPEDRQHGGLVLDASVADNLALGRARRHRAAFASIARAVAALAERADRRARHPARRIPTRSRATLSGGNQQKIVIGARAVAARRSPRSSRRSRRAASTSARSRASTIALRAARRPAPACS